MAVLASASRFGRVHPAYCSCMYNACTAWRAFIADSSSGSLAGLKLLHSLAQVVHEVQMALDLLAEALGSLRMMRKDPILSSRP